MSDENANLEKRTTTFVDNHDVDNVKKRFELIEKNDINWQSNVDHNINDDDDGGSGDSNDTITDNHHHDHHDDDHNDKRNDINNDNDHEINNNNNFDEKIRIAMAKIHEANIRKVKNELCPKKFFFLLL